MKQREGKWIKEKSRKVKKKDRNWTKLGEKKKAENKIWTIVDGYSHLISWCGTVAFLYQS